MNGDEKTFFRALAAKDRRFDGVFFVGVSTTGVYCRPICPARTPARDRCTFFSHPALAERAGYRACFRCRPELAPGASSVDSLSRLARAAASLIDSGYLDGRSLEDLARHLGTTSRHLRRALSAELGVSPVELAESKRLAHAKRLLQDTTLSSTEIAFAAGFSSVRRYNAAFKRRFGRAPTAVRARPSKDAATFDVRLAYRPPLAWRELLAFLGARSVPGIERITGETYERAFGGGESFGVVRVKHDEARAELVASVPISLAPALRALVPGLRALFDLDARPDVIDAHLATDSKLRPLVAKRPGLRVPGSFDAFETAVRAVLGQQISVAGATTLTARFVETFGKKQGDWRSFPTPERVAAAPLAEVRAVGMPASRAQTLIDLAHAIAHGRVSLDGSRDPVSTCAALESLRGIGPWTASYVAMRALAWPDAFPAGDYGVKKALGVTRESHAAARSEAWRPWRAYAVMHLWSSLEKES